MDESDFNVCTFYDRFYLRQQGNLLDLEGCPALCNIFGNGKCSFRNLMEKSFK